jgi:hypothetical protein
MTHICDCNCWSIVLEKLVVPHLVKEFSEVQHSVYKTFAFVIILIQMIEVNKLISCLRTISILTYNLYPRIPKLSPYLHVFLTKFHKQITKSFFIESILVLSQRNKIIQKVNIYI